MAEASILDVLFISHTDAFGTFRVGSHHLARELARGGRSVAHVSTPVSTAHVALRRIEQRQIALTRESPIVDSDGVIHIVDHSSFPAGVGRYDPTRSLRTRLGFTSAGVVLLDQPLMWNPALRTYGRRLVYRPTDLYETGLKRHLQAKVLAHADGVIATSQTVLDSLALSPGVPREVIANGVELERFADTGGPREKIAVYVGAVDGRFSWSDMMVLGRTSPDWRFEVHGPRGQTPHDLPQNVVLAGPARYADLPSILGRASIGLLPLSDDPLNQGRSPMKLYEYLAAGLAVVGTSTPGFSSDPASGVFAYGDPDGLVSAFSRAARAGLSGNDAGMRLAREHDWRIKARQVADFVDGLA